MKLLIFCVFVLVFSGGVVVASGGNSSGKSKLPKPIKFSSSLLHIEGGEDIDMGGFRIDSDSPEFQTPVRRVPSQVSVTSAEIASVKKIGISSGEDKQEKTSVKLEEKSKNIKNTKRSDEKLGPEKASDPLERGVIKVTASELNEIDPFVGTFGHPSLGVSNVSDQSGFSKSSLLLDMKLEGRPVDASSFESSNPENIVSAFSPPVVAPVW